MQRVVPNDLWNQNKKLNTNCFVYQTSKKKITFKIYSTLCKGHKCFFVTSEPKDKLIKRNGYKKYKKRIKVNWQSWSYKYSLMGWNNQLHRTNHIPLSTLEYLRLSPKFKCKKTLVWQISGFVFYMKLEFYDLIVYLYLSTAFLKCLKQWHCHILVLSSKPPCWHQELVLSDLPNSLLSKCQVLPVH